MFTAVRLSRLLALVLCLGIIAAIAYWAGQLMAPRVAIAPSSIASSATESSIANQTWMGQLFGNPPAAIVMAAVSSNMSLQGLLSGARPAAVISVDGKIARPYGLGDEIQPGVKVKSISTEQVVLDRNGEQISLAAPAKRTTSVLTNNEGKPRAGTAAPLPSPAAATPAFGAAATASPTVPLPATPYPPAQAGSAGLGTSFSPPAENPPGIDAGSNTPRPRNQMKEGRIDLPSIPK
jgi:type II secretory pathway component PulC